LPPRVTAANSVVSVLPKMIAPAARRDFTQAASIAGKLFS
jgi:hypothetical protein